MIQTSSIITCPDCGLIKEETMPVNSCQHFCTYSFCQILLNPKKGNCCVFCSYGSIPYPPNPDAKSA